MTGLDVTKAWTYALRDLRGGVRDLRIFLLCLILGVASIASVLSLSASVVQGVQDNARLLVGGDIELRTSGQAMPPEVIRYMTETAGALSHVRSLRAMIHVRDGAEITSSALADVKAVDAAYPMVGAVQTASGQNLRAALDVTDEYPGALAERSLLLRLGAEVGDIVRLGTLDVRITDLITVEPDRNTSVFGIGPRLMVSAETLETSSLLQRGSLVRHQYRLLLEDPETTGAYNQTIRDRFPDSAFYIRDIRNAEPALQDFINRFGIYLTLVGLTALLIGGIGIGTAVRNHLDAKTDTIATLKCLGATGGFIFTVYFGQVMAVAVLGVALGLVLGGAAPFLVPFVVSDDLASLAAPGIYPLALGIASAYGLLMAALFALLPLARAQDIPAAHLFRDVVSVGTWWPKKRYIIMIGAVVVALIALALITSGDAPRARESVLGMIIALIFFRLLATGFLAILRRVPRPRSTVWRLALSNLTRPGAPTAGIAVSIGTGLSVLVAVAQLDVNLESHIREAVPDMAPSFFMIDIQPTQVDGFDQIMADANGVERVDRVPAVLGRLHSVKGIPIAEAEIDRRSQWLTRQEIFMSYAAAPPDDTNPIVAGKWWPEDYNGAPLVSFSRRHAERLNVGVGDTLTFNILGRPITATIANLREVSWRNRGVSFLAIFAPGLLERAPLMHVATVYADTGDEDVIFNSVTSTYPNITILRTKDVVDTISSMADRMAAAVRATALLTLSAGVLVLAGAVAAGHQRRVYDSVILHVLGATRGTLTRAYILEFLLLSGVCVSMAILVGSLGAGIVTDIVMRGDWFFPPVATALAAGVGIGLILAFGYLGTWRALGQKPMPVLRTV